MLATALRNISTGIKTKQREYAHTHTNINNSGTLPYVAAFL